MLRETFDHGKQPGLGNENFIVVDGRNSISQQKKKKKRIPYHSKKRKKRKNLLCDSVCRFHGSLRIKAGISNILWTLIYLLRLYKFRSLPFV